MYTARRVCGLSGVSSPPNPHGSAPRRYKAWIVAGLVVLALLLGVSAGVQYSVRGSHLAQRTAGVAGVAAAVF